MVLAVSLRGLRGLLSVTMSSQITTMLKDQSFLPLLLHLKMQYCLY
jgi:hypothetical protein